MNLGLRQNEIKIIITKLKTPIIHKNSYFFVCNDDNEN